MHAARVWSDTFLSASVSGQFYVMMSPQDMLDSSSQRQLIPGSRAESQLVNMTTQDEAPSPKGASRDGRRRVTHNEG